MKNPKITKEEIGIIKKAQTGDERAFSKLFNRYKSFVSNILFKYIGDMDEARDITNVVFLKVHEKLSMFTDYSSFGGWLRIITNHTAIDYLREIKRKKASEDIEDGRLLSDVSTESAEIELVNQLTYEQLLSEFNALPETTRKVCLMFYKDNLTVKQISEMLSIPIGTVKSTLSRTRKRIKQSFKNN